jgi:hypothetical protein
MAAHEAEHVGQLLQKQGLENSCPKDCRGALGFIFDVEWVHFAYNSSILVALGVIGWLIRPPMLGFLSAAIAVQSATVADDRLVQNAREEGAFVNAEIVH